MRVFRTRICQELGVVHKAENSVPERHVQRRDDNVLRDLGEQFDLVQEQSLIRALARLSREEFAGLYLASDHLQDALDLGRSLQNERILEGMPDGVALVDNNNDIVWAQRATYALVPNR